MMREASPVPYPLGGSQGDRARRAMIALAFLVLLPCPLLSGCSDDDPVRPQSKRSARFVSEWGGPGSGPGLFDAPVGLAADCAGRVYVADLGNGRVQQLDDAGGFLGEWRSDPGVPFSPAGIAVSGDSAVYVTDIGRQMVYRFDPTGDIDGSWDGSGTVEGRFDMPMAIAVDAAGYVYVADREHYRIQKFTSRGVFVTSWAAGRPQKDRYYWGPHGLACARDGAILMVEWHDWRVYRYSASGDSLGEWDHFGLEAGEVSNLYGLAVDRRGDVYVTDETIPRVVVYSASGEFAFEFGEEGTQPGQFDLPWGIAVGPSDDVYVADTMRNSVLHFEVR